MIKDNKIKIADHSSIKYGVTKNGIFDIKENLEFINEFNMNPYLD
jgi:hypothetical protein